MSRSYKKNSITGNCSSKSEKKDKQIYNKKLRRNIKQIMKKEEVDDWLFPSLNETQNIWLMSKDGKSHFDSKKFPELLRK